MKFTRTSFAVATAPGRLKSAARFSTLPAICLAAFLFAAAHSQAQFSPGPNPITGTVTGTQSISSGTGTVEGTLSLSGKNVPIIMSGTSTVINNGIIQQNLSGNNSARAIQSSGTGAVLVIQNNAGALIFTGSNDSVAAGTGSTTVTSVTLTNSGTIQSLNGGGQAVNFNKIQTGSNSVTNSGFIYASASDAIRPGVSGTVSNSGTIQSISVSQSSSDGIDGQTNTGIGISNSGLVDGGRHGITGGNTNIAVASGSYAMAITNLTGGTIKGEDGSGINIDGINANEQVVITNAAGAFIFGNGLSADGDGVDVDGIVNITNNGVIKSLNAFNDTSEGITVGGGTIINTGTIEGDIISGSGGTGTGRGITFAGVDKDTNGNPISPQGIYGPVSVTNSGLIKGQSNSGITITGSTSGFQVTITNQAGGNIEGDGATMAAIQGSNDNTTVTNSGTIMAASSGTAIIFGSGSNVLNITGGQASIVGNIVGGSGTDSMAINPGAGNSFSYSGTISSFSSVAVNSGTVTFTGASTYSGSTTITGGKLIVNGSIANSAVTVSSGGVLAGSGTSGFITVSAGSRLAPGDPTSFTATGLAINGGATANGGGVYHVDITAGAGAPVAGTSYDQTVLTGGGVALSLDKTDSTGSILSLNVSGTLRASGIGSPGNPYDPTSGNVSLDNYFILKLQAGSATLDPANNRFALASDGTNYVAINYNPAEFSWDNPGGIGTFTLDGQEWAISYVGDYETNSTIGGNDVVITAIPEPRTYALAIGGFGLLFLFRRRRRRGSFTSSK